MELITDGDISNQNVAAYVVRGDGDLELIAVFPNDGDSASILSGPVQLDNFASAFSIARFFVQSLEYIRRHDSFYLVGGPTPDFPSVMTIDE